MRAGLPALPDRRAVEHAIEALIALLDQCDGDDDIEEDDDSGDPLDRGEMDDSQAYELPTYDIDQPHTSHDIIAAQKRLLAQAMAGGA